MGARRSSGHVAGLPDGVERGGDHESAKPKDRARIPEVHARTRKRFAG